MSLQDNRTDGIRTITIARPPMNALDLDTIKGLALLFKGHPADLPLVLEGAGAAFSAGVDTKAFADYGSQERLDLARAITGMTAALLAVPAPVVAAIKGHALGGGLVLALCCDYRIATDDESAKFGLMEARAGVPFPSGPVEIVRDELPGPLLRSLTLTSRAVPSSFLAGEGVFDELAAPEAIGGLARERAQELASQPAFAAVKAQMRGALAARVAARAREAREPFFGS